MKCSLVPTWRAMPTGVLSCEPPVCRRRSATAPRNLSTWPGCVAYKGEAREWGEGGGKIKEIDTCFDTHVSCGRRPDNLHIGIGPGTACHWLGTRGARGLCLWHCGRAVIMQPLAVAGFAGDSLDRYVFIRKGCILSFALHACCSSFHCHTLTWWCGCL